MQSFDWKKLRTIQGLKRFTVRCLARTQLALLRHTENVPATGDGQAWTQAWLRFTNTSLIGHANPELAAVAHAQCFADACTLLSSSHFSTLPVAQRAATIIALHNTLMSAPSSDLFPIAELGLRQFQLMLADSALTDAQAMGVYDALHSLYFSGVTDVLDLHRFDAIVQPFETWLLKRHPPRNQHSAIRSPEGPLTIAYLLHTGHFDRGNAVSPLIASMAAAHAATPGRRVFLYLVQYVGPNFLVDIADRAFIVRSFPQQANYNQIDEIAAALRADHVDVVVTEQNRSIAAALYARRVAPLQIWADTGFPFWSLRSLDWTLAPAASGAPDMVARKSRLTWRQEIKTLKQSADPGKIAAVRSGFPKEAFILGVFVRLVKLNEPYFQLLSKLLAVEPAFHLIIAGTGDAKAVRDFMARPGHADRITFLHENVDLNIYAQVVDVMCDTFPFIGGNACREVAAHGTPVVSMLGTPWDALLRDDRSPDLLATDMQGYIDRVRRLHRDHQFRDQQRKIVLDMFEQQTDPKQMIVDVEKAIAAAGACRKAAISSSRSS